MKNVSRTQSFSMYRKNEIRHERVCIPLVCDDKFMIVNENVLGLTISHFSFVHAQAVSDLQLTATVHTFFSPEKTCATRYFRAFLHSGWFTHKFFFCYCCLHRRRCFCLYIGRSTLYSANYLNLLYVSNLFILSIMWKYSFVSFALRSGFTVSHTKIFHTDLPSMLDMQKKKKKENRIQTCDQD